MSTLVLMPSHLVLVKRLAVVVPTMMMVLQITLAVPGVAETT